MAQPTANINPLTDTFNDWLTKTNVTLDALNRVIVTANTTLGAVNGNSHVNGFFAANTLVALGNVMGGTVQTNSSSLPEIVSANLTFISNSIFNSNVFIANVTTQDRANTTHTNTHLFQDTTTFTGVVNSTANAFFSGNTAFSGNATGVNFSFSGNVTSTGTTGIGGTLNITAVTNTSGNVSFFSNVIAFSSNTRISANGSNGVSSNTAYQILSSSNGSLHWRDPPITTILDSVVNTSVTIAAAANSVKTAYDAAIAANNLANQAMVAAGSNSQFASQQAYVNAVAYANAAVQVAYANAANLAVVLSTAAYTNAVAQANTFAGTAHANAVTFATTIANTAFTNAVAVATTLASQAFSNAVSSATNLSSNAYINAVAFATTVAGQAFSNAVSRASNATNLATGTVPTARLGGGSPSAATYLRGDGQWAPNLTDLSQFTNSPGFINGNGRAYPRIVGGGDFNLNWSGQGGQPSWLVGGNDGSNFYVYNPSNFNVNYAASAGSASSAGFASSAGSVSWNNIAGRPTDLGAFSNGPGYISTASFAFSNGITGYIIFPNGFKIMWGRLAVPANVAQYPISYPTSFASYSVPTISGGNIGTGTSTNGPEIVPPGGQTTVFYVSNSFNFATSSWWIAVGF